MEKTIQHGEIQVTIGQVNPFRRRLFRIVNLKKHYVNIIYGNSSIKSAKHKIIESTLLRMILPLLFLNFYIVIFSICNLVGAHWILKLYIAVFSLAALIDLIFSIGDRFFKDVALKFSKKTLNSIIAYKKASESTFLSDLKKNLAAAVVAQFEIDDENLSLITHKDRARTNHRVIVAMLALLFYTNPQFIISVRINYDISYYIGHILLDNLLSGFFGVSGIENMPHYQFNRIDKLLLGMLGIFLGIQSFLITKSISQTQSYEFRLLEGSFSSVKSYVSLLPDDYQSLGAIGVVDYGWLDAPELPVMWYMSDIRALASAESELLINDAENGDFSKEKDKWEFTLPLRVAVKSKAASCDNEQLYSIEDIQLREEKLLVYFSGDALAFQFNRMRLGSDGVFAVDAHGREFRFLFEYLWPFSERINENLEFIVESVSTIDTEKEIHVAIFFMI